MLGLGSNIVGGVGAIEYDPYQLLWEWDHTLDDVTSIAWQIEIEPSIYGKTNVLKVSDDADSDNLESTYVRVNISLPASVTSYESFKTVAEVYVPSANDGNGGILKITTFGRDSQDYGDIARDEWTEIETIGSPTTTFLYSYIYFGNDTTSEDPTDNVWYVYSWKVYGY